MHLITRYASFLRLAGYDVFLEDGIEWFNYKGVLQPVDFPCELPHVSRGTAQRARRRSGCLMARWTENYDKAIHGGWWHVIRDGDYSIAQLSGNTRSKINRGKKRLTASLLSPEDVEREGYAVCVAAVARFGSEEFLPSRESFERKVWAAREYPECFEFWGVYRGTRLVGLCECHLHNGGVFMESIWYDPEGLQDYSSYVLIDAVLNEFLVNRGAKYVSDGSRSIYHETAIHEFLQSKFSFRKAGSDLRVEYSPALAVVMACLRPFGSMIRTVGAARPSGLLRKLGALCLQDSIARGAVGDRIVGKKIKRG